MKVSELTPITDDALPLDLFKEYLQLGVSVQGSALQGNSLLRHYVRAAIDHVEMMSGYVLLERHFKLSFENGEQGKTHLVLKPATALLFARVEEKNGQQSDISLDDLGFKPGSEELILPRRAYGQALIIGLRAGYASWSELPYGLAEAVLKLAATLYNNRGGEVHDFRQIEALIAPYRHMSISGERND